VLCGHGIVTANQQFISIIFRQKQGFTGPCNYYNELNRYSLAYQRNLYGSRGCECRASILSVEATRFLADGKIVVLEKWYN
jgi:hypothetical protein